MVGSGTFPAVQPDRSLLFKGFHQILPVLMTLGPVPVVALCFGEGPVVPDHDQSLDAGRTPSVLALKNSTLEPNLLAELV